MESSNIKEIADKYNRIAGNYDTVDRFIPSRWRRRAAGLACGRVLEVGIGTGLNFPFYADCCTEIVGIDISSGMLEKAKERASQCKAPVRLEIMDVQELPLAAESFDSVLAAFVFCTVPNPLQGLRECRRVLKPGGKLILLEHTGSGNGALRQFMDWLNPFTVRFLGDHINRDTGEVVAMAGFTVRSVNNLLGDVVRLVVAEK